jgi:WD40 repeat protein/serine/threonine protein kinase
MTMIDFSTIESIFFAALDKPAGEERAAYLNEACGTDTDLRKHVERMLAAQPHVGNFLKQPAPVVDRSDREPAVSEATATFATHAPTANPDRDPDRTSDHRPTDDPGLILAGRYKLIEPIGEGGMGSVWMAQQIEPVKRPVAVKLIKAGMDSGAVLARFEAERQALAMMDHPNIAKVLDAGMSGDGRPFFVMELVKGVPITQFCDARKLTPRERLELFVPVCQAIQHAHQKGIIHRDIKPTNVLVALYDDRPVPKVIDFGVAKAAGQPLTDRTLMTGFGSVVGTPEYMSPEQASFNQMDVDTRSDVYSLGVLLYELLTGSPPHPRKELEKAGLLEILRVIREIEPPRPSARLSTSHTLASLAAVRGIEPARLTRLVRGELDWIVMKALDKDRTRRYETANGFAAEVQRYLAGEPVQAVPPSTSYRLQKFIRRHRAGVLTAAAFVLLLFAGAAISTWQAVVATHAEREAQSSENAARVSEEVAQEQKREADIAKNQAEQQRNELALLYENSRRNNYVADMNLARVAWDENNLIRTRELLDKHRNRTGETDLRGFEWHYLRRLLHGDVRAIKVLEGTVSAVAFLPDGQRLLTAGIDMPPIGTTFFEGATGQVKLWDVASGKQLDFQLKGLPRKLEKVTLSPDGTQVAVTCWDHAVRLWDLGTGEQFTLEGPLKHMASGARFSPDGKRLVTAHHPDDGFENTTKETHSIRIWDLASRKAVTIIDRLPLNSGANLSPDGKFLAVCIPEQSIVKVVEAATGKESYRCDYRGGYVLRVAFSPDGKRLFACGDKGIRVWDAATRETVAVWPVAARAGSSMALSPDGKRLAVGVYEGVVELLDTATGQRIHTFKGHSGRLLAMAFNSDGSRLATGGVDGTVRIWNTGERHEDWPFGKASAHVQTPELSLDGQTLLGGLQEGVGGMGYGKSLQLWDASTAQPRGGSLEMQQVVRSYDWTGDGKRLFLADEGKTVSIVDVATSKVVHAYPADLERASEGKLVTALSPNEKWYAHSAPGKTIQVRNAQTGVEYRVLKDLDNLPHRLAFNADGSRLASVDESGAVKFWDVGSGSLTATAKLGGMYVTRMRFSPDGKRLAVVGSLVQILSGEVRILDTDSGREIYSLKGHTLNVSDGVFSPDGKRLATISLDRAIRIWDVNTAQEILKLSDFPSRVTCIRFTMDGHRLVGASWDQTVRVRVWDATPQPE